MEAGIKTNKVIEGKKIYLRLLTLNDVSAAYFKWMKDKEVTAFLEHRKENTTFIGLRRYVKSIIRNRDNYFFGIFTKAGGKHIGNIKIGGIHKIHKFADLGILIGDKQVWGKGYGTEAINLASKYAFEVLHLHKIYAGMNEVNIASLIAFKKAGFKQAGRLKEHIYFKGKYKDSIIVERIDNK